MLTMFTYALGGVDLDIMLGSSNPEASILLSLLYQFAMGTVLMSLLTGGVVTVVFVRGVVVGYQELLDS
jgi:hypothetical protein